MSHLQQRFELAPRSQLAEAVVDRVNEVLAEHERATETRRLQPGELLVEIGGEFTPIPLLTLQWSERLGGSFKATAVCRHLEYEQL
ncbi:MAG: hypothetical protein GX878_05720 [Firmicutes bacterium]|nr:hypothetical protein [Bacillota bacterium]